MGNPEKEREAAFDGAHSEAPPPAYEDTEMIPPYERPRVANASHDQQLISATVKFTPFLICVHSSLSLSTCHLGKDDKDKRYHVKATSKDVILREGPNKTDTVMAQVTTLAEGVYGKSSVYVPRPTGEPISFVMPGDHSNRQPFSLRVGKDSHLEHFEWRQSQGKEIEEVGKTKLHGYGWKLVRLTGDVEGAGGKRKDREFGFTSDGKEIVAACAMTSKFWKGPNFSFMGTGLTGTLGEQFEIVAVVTFLRIMWLQIQRSAQSGAPFWYNEKPHPGMVEAEADPSGSNR